MFCGFVGGDGGVFVLEEVKTCSSYLNNGVNTPIYFTKNVVNIAMFDTLFLCLEEIWRHGY